ncbi:carboxymuconolactone decarboxylase family protein [Haladaptatus sp. ZSTT2]|uniref:carboxymuconolactone decarboxylase family protein n=1 Tax=Haladaptatus sp. ZSTT2 TaxID=3120515 RepID=UPI00300ECD52
MGTDDREEGAEERRARLAEHVEETNGYLGNHLTALREIDPTFFEAYLNLAEHPWKTGPLDPKVKEFILISLSSATTSFNATATREHIGRALDRGATFKEVLEVLELTSILGMHSATEGYPVVVEETDLAGEGDPELVATLLEDLEAHKPFFSAVWDDVLAIIENDPTYWQHLYAFLRHPYGDRVLPPKVMEFIYIAIDIGTSHLYTAGLRVHVRNALMVGATPEEILEVIQLASATGIHAVSDGLPLLLEEAKQRDALPEALKDH